MNEDQVPNTTPAYDEEEDEYDDFSSDCYVSSPDDIGATTESPAARAATYQYSRDGLDSKHHHHHQRQRQPPLLRGFFSSHSGRTVVTTTATAETTAATTTTTGMLVPESILNNVFGAMGEGVGVGLMVEAVTGCVRAIAGHT